MDYFKSDFLKLLYVFIVSFSFTTGCPNENKALEICKSSMKKHFGVDSSLLSCVEKAILDYKDSRDGYWLVGVYMPPVIYDRKSYYNPRITVPQDVYNYYMRMHTLVSPVNIDAVKPFCKGISAKKKKLTEESEPSAKKKKITEESDTDTMEKIFPEERNPNTKKCIDNLRTFEVNLPFVKPIVENPIDYQNFKSNSPSTSISRDEFVLKKTILYNALYLFDLSGEYKKGTYIGVYLEDIASKLDLINGNDYNPIRFCNDEHAEKKNDEGTSISS